MSPRDFTPTVYVDGEDVLRVRRVGPASWAADWRLTTSDDWTHAPACTGLTADDAMYKLLAWRELLDDEDERDPRDAWRMDKRAELEW